MPPKKSPIWKHFKDDVNDETNAICQIPGCKKPKVSRGKEGSAKGNLSNASMANHLKTNHPKEYSDFRKDKVCKEASEKRIAEEQHETRQDKHISTKLISM